jgi:branched-subunit amino acid ABC-type transport system permease component
VLRWVVGKPDFVIVMLTLGLATVVGACLDAAFGAVPRPNGDPWGSAIVPHLAGLGLLWVQVWTIVAAVALLVGF